MAQACLLWHYCDRWFPVRITALDLSRPRSRLPGRQSSEGPPARCDLHTGQPLSLPFADNSFDFVFTSGASNTCRWSGLRELAQ
jgi:ubiquinone/menaquinone biosynthesis C-methylase UbiE